MLLTAPSRAGEVFDHPLLSPGASEALAAHPELTEEELLSELVLLDGGMIDQDGRWTDLSGAAMKVAETDKELAARPPTEDPPAELFLDEAVLEALSDPGQAGVALDVTLSIDQSFSRGLRVPQEQMLAVLRGEVRTREDFVQVRLDTVAAREKAGQDALAGLTDEALALGAEVVESGPLAGSLRLLATPAVIQRLAERPEVIGIYAASKVTEDAGQSMLVEGTLDGLEREDLLQSRLYYNAGYFGDPEERIMIAETRGDEIRSTHPALTDTAGSRRVLLCGGTGPTCVDSAPIDGVDHPTKVAHVLLGDTTASQDATISGISEQRKRSGIAREAKGIGSKADGRGMLIAETNSDVFLYNQSASKGISDPTCRGATSNSRDLDTMFELGVGVFGSDGNQAHSSTTDCTNSEPWNAMGALNVSAYYVTEQIVPAIPSEEEIASSASMGGTSVQPGNGRTIKGLALPSDHTLLAEGLSSASPQYSTDGFCCSSGAAPALTGSAALFRQWYLDTQSSQIDDPAVLYTALLLMGDRTGQSGSLSTGFDPLWGAGKLRLRLLDADGLDGPAGWGIGSVCVDHGQSVYIPLGNGQELTGAMDYVKAVTWWYDSEYDDSTTTSFDKFDLVAQRRVPGSWVWASQVTSNSDDSRQRVFQSGGVSGYHWQLEITGRDVGSDNEGCGQNSNRVYYAWMYEDNARDDDATLDTFVRPEP